jgi:hypothetical protein
VMTAQSGKTWSFMSEEVLPQGTVVADTTPQVDATAAPITDPVPDGSEVKQPEPEKTFTQKELDEILEKRLAKERRRFDQKLSRTLDTLATKAPETPAPQAGEAPKREAFKSDEEYALALVDYRAEQKATQLFEKRDREVKEAREREAQETVVRTHEERVAKAEEKYEDFDEVCRNRDLRITDEMAEAIRLSETGPDIWYHLGKNPAEAARIAALNPVLAVKELGKLEVKLASAPPAKKPSSAPAPITPVAPNGGNVPLDTTDPKSLERLGTSAWIAAERERQRRNWEAKNR